jgi:hypothetical protein
MTSILTFFLLRTLLLIVNAGRTNVHASNRIFKRFDGSFSFHSSRAELSRMLTICEPFVVLLMVLATTRYLYAVTVHNSTIQQFPFTPKNSYSQSNLPNIERVRNVQKR